jgi:hypothetical protein
VNVQSQFISATNTEGSHAGSYVNIAIFQFLYAIWLVYGKVSNISSEEFVEIVYLYIFQEFIYKNSSDETCVIFVAELLYNVLLQDQDSILHILYSFAK